MRRLKHGLGMLIAMFALVGLFTLTGCEKAEDGAGDAADHVEDDAEHAKEHAEEAADGVGDAIKDATGN